MKAYKNLFNILFNSVAILLLVNTASNLFKTNRILLKISKSFFFNLLIAASISCNFDQDFCGYTSKDDKFIRYSGKSPSPSSGPSADKTTGTI